MGNSGTATRELPNTPELAGLSDRTGQGYVVSFLGYATVDDDEDSVRAALVTLEGKR